MWRRFKAWWASWRAERAQRRLPQAPSGSLTVTHRASDWFKIIATHDGRSHSVYAGTDSRAAKAAWLAHRGQPGHAELRHNGVLRGVYEG